ncbi:MAG: hypothetical protein ACOXZS_04295 [Bacilli bacterium]
MLKRWLLLLMLISYKVYALDNNIYLTYSDWSDWQETKIEETPLIEVQVEKKYRWYMEDRIDGDYYIENENDPSFPLIDRSNYLETTFSEFTNDQPHMLPNRIVEEKRVYRYRHMRPVRYIYILNPHNFFGHFYIPELNVLINGQKVSYDYYCGRCSNDFSSKINDNNVLQTDVYLYNNTELRIDLGGYYNVEDIRIDLYLYDPILSSKSFDIMLSPYFNFTQPQYFFKSFSEYFYCNDITEVKLFSLQIDNSWLKEPEWFEWECSDDPITPSLTTEVDQIHLYRYKDILYKHYRLDKIYYDDNYYPSAPDLAFKRDDNDYKYYYRYRTKSIIEPTDDKEPVTPSNNEVSSNTISTSNENADDIDMPDSKQHNSKKVENSKPDSQKETLISVNNNKINKILISDHKLPVWEKGINVSKKVSSIIVTIIAYLYTITKYLFSRKW